ncbi:MAG: class I SAM-dependent methyltransferase [Planctomycetota bacterium]
MSDLRRRWRFLSRYLRDPKTVGAVGPSSRALAAALSDPFKLRTRPARVLEVGAGTGAITRHLGGLLAEDDELDICEKHPDFARILERDVLARADFRPAIQSGRVRLLHLPVQELTHENRYDFVISGLPLTAFGLRDVHDVFKVIRRSLKPGGIFSYFEYVGLRRTSRLLWLGKQRRRIRMVSAYLSKHIKRHQFDTRTVLRNFPPAHARHLRFDN